MHALPRPYLHGFAVLTLVLAASCSSGSEPSSIGLAVTSALSVSQGTSASTAITVTRSHFDQPLHLSVTGGSAGITAAVLPATISGSVLSAELRVAASGTANPGTQQLTIHATGDGVGEQTSIVDVTVSVAGSYSLSTQDATVRVAQNGGNGTTILLTRVGGHADSVHLAVTGAPAGMVVVAQPTATVTGDSWLDVSAPASVAPGLYTLTIHGTANGLSEQTTTVKVRVIAPPSTASLTYSFCPGEEPGWFAYQNDGSRWQRVTASNSAFTFDATSKVGVAFTFVEGDFSRTIVYFGTRNEFAANNLLDCGGPISVTGKALGLVTGQSAILTMGASGDVAAQGSPSVTIGGLPTRPLDLVGTSGVSGNDFTPDKMIVYRGLTPSDGDTLPTLDFNGPDAFDLSTSTLTVSGKGSFEFVQQQNTLWSATSTYGAVQATGNAPTSMTLYSVPPAHLAAGDLHELAVVTGPISGNSGREVYSYYAATGDRTETFGPALSTVTVSSYATHPYLRLSGQMASQPEYGDFALFGFEQVTQTDDRLLFIGVTTDYLGALPSVWNVVIPNFGSVFGFNPNWMPQVGELTYYVAEALAAPPRVLFGAMPQDGDRVLDAYVFSQTQSLRALRGLGSLRGPRISRRGRTLALLSISAGSSRAPSR